MPKQFGEEAQRVSNQEVKEVFDEVNGKVGNLLAGFELTNTLEEKQSHGDIDILALLHPDQEILPIISSLKPLKRSKNGYCHSFLYETDSGKKVHIDFLVSTDPILHQVKRQYYSFNFLSPVIGLMAKKLNFKYGSEGFFKRYEDKRGNWHDILISTNLNPGLQCLGLEPKPLWIRTYKDIVNYVSSSLLFDSSMCTNKREEETRYLQRQIYSELFDLNKRAMITEEDYFFRRQFPQQFSQVESKKKEIEDKIYRMSRYNGTWLQEKFGMKPGPEIGKMLKLISDSFGDLLGEVEEELVEAFVNEQLGEDNVN